MSVHYSHEIVTVSSCCLSILGVDLLATMMGMAMNAKEQTLSQERFFALDMNRKVGGTICWCWTR